MLPSKILEKNLKHNKSWLLRLEPRKLLADTPFDKRSKYLQGESCTKCEANRQWIENCSFVEDKIPWAPQILLKYELLFKICKHGPQKQFAKVSCAGCRYEHRWCEATSQSLTLLKNFNCLSARQQRTTLSNEAGVQNRDLERSDGEHILSRDEEGDNRATFKEGTGEVQTTTSKRQDVKQQKTIMKCLSCVRNSIFSKIPATSVQKIFYRIESPLVYHLPRYNLGAVFMTWN